jgi:hypothetical protein
MAMVQEIVRDRIYYLDVLDEEMAINYMQGNSNGKGVENNLNMSFPSQH